MRALRENTRDVEHVLHDVSVSLRQFQGPNGLRCLLEHGKLSILSVLGEFQKTSDEVYSDRMKVVSQTRAALMRLTDQFEMVGKTVESLIFQLDEVFSDLQQFMEVCERHLESKSPSVNGEEEFSSIQLVGSNLRTLANDLTCNIKVNCCGIQSASLGQLEETYADVMYEVGRAQTSFDGQRRKAQVCENELKKARSGAQSDRVEVAEGKFQRSLEALQKSGDQYNGILQRSMDKTSFVLEQVSMSTWDASNVFFLQLSTFFKDAVKGFDQVADTLLSVKNGRGVSKRINSEKRAAATASVQQSSQGNADPLTPQNYELVDLFSVQPEEKTVPRFESEDLANRGAREYDDIDDIFK
ncbi:hypothetical protein DQ04_00371210 [Trypanosoma grayi]|uniref:hypothetical protein n=1 Tax=Trypanosoma grayi TaxID=71804 RepID=UPI0004F414B3|nr:hypothetical protein DQ04_00371210 [Trypanosoma grayi]KEG14635.1 hypothetical protein DQ04_00371210 [Trypanosoma grayi]